MKPLTPKPLFVPTSEPPLRVRGRFRPLSRKPLAPSRFRPPPPTVILKPKSPLHEIALRLQANAYQTLSPEQKKARRSQRDIDVRWITAHRLDRQRNRKRRPRVRFEKKVVMDRVELDVFDDLLHRVHSLNTGYFFE